MDLNKWNEISQVGNPKERNDYLIYTKDKNMYVALWSKIWEKKDFWEWDIRCECSNAEDCLLMQQEITHWMELPDDPK